MANSRDIAALVGPTMIALGATEALNPDMFADQIAPVVYLNGAILFVALALVGAFLSYKGYGPSDAAADSR